MKNARAGSKRQTNLAAPETAENGAIGWYLYGIARRLPLAAVLADATDDAPLGSDEAETADVAPLQLLEYAGLVAVVRPVPLADFTPAVLQERLQGVDELEAMVRSHNHVIEEIHAQQAILPARFGMVYTDARDIVTALRTTHEKLAQQLDALEGCDEWAVHLHADRTLVRERISEVEPEVVRLRDELLTARPGRAYFLEQQLRDQLEAATHQALVVIAQGALDRLAAHAVAAQPSSVGPLPGSDEVEILRAAFLVKRDDADAFLEDARGGIGAAEGMRCECSGPWPPYSFATRSDEVTA